MEIFSRIGLAGAFLIAHVIVAIMWMGLLWFFNFVQTPAYAEMDAGARNNAFDKLTWRALWWFRWAAAATVVFGLLDHRDRRQRHASAATSGSRQQRGPDAARSASCSASRCSTTCGWSSGRTSRSSSPTPATCRPAARPTPTLRPRPAPARWRPVRTRSSRSRCSCSWSAPSHFYALGRLRRRASAAASGSSTC